MEKCYRSGWSRSERIKSRPVRIEIAQNGYHAHRIAAAALSRSAVARSNGGSGERKVQMFGRKSRAERLKEQAESTSFIPTTAIAGVLTGARPIAERLLYDDDLRDNIRTFIEAIREIADEVSDEKPVEIVSKLWDDDKLRSQIEAAAGAAQQGSKRVRGEKVKESGGSGKLLLLLIVAALGFLFLNPRTGPEARRLVGEAVGAVTGD